MGTPKQKTERKVIPLMPIRVEREFLDFPLHRLTGRGKNNTLEKIEIEGVDQDGNQLLWRVTANAQYGAPGELAYKLDRLYIDRLLDKAGTKKPKYIPLGTISEIAKVLGRDNSGHSLRQIRNALKQNALAGLEIKKTIILKDGSEDCFEGCFTRYSVFFRGEKLPNGSRADRTWIVLSDPWHWLLNSVGTRPLNYEYLQILPPMAQRFYELVTPKVFGCLKYGRPFARYTYSEFCRNAPQTRYLKWEQVKKQMYKVLRHHKNSGYLESVGYQQFKDEVGRLDWEMQLIPGPLALLEFDKFTRGKVEARASGRKALPQKDELSEEEKKQRELVVRFWKAKGIEPTIFLKKDLKIANELLERLGQEKASFVVEHAATAKKPADVFGGVKYHLTQALDAFEKQKEKHRHHRLREQRRQNTETLPYSQEDLLKNLERFKLKWRPPD